MNRTKTIERPVAITVICLLGFFGAAISIPLLFTSVVRNVGPWYPPTLGVSALVGLVCMIGLWNMQKWAAFAYTALVVVGQVILITMSAWNVFSLLLPSFVIAIAFAHLPKMR